MLGASALLAAVYFLTERVIDDQIDSVIESELDVLSDLYQRDGEDGLVAELRLRTDSWGRTGAIYLLVDKRMVKEAGNLSAWPLAAAQTAPWAEFVIQARHLEATVPHPVRARVLRLPAGQWLLVGTDMSERYVFQRRFLVGTAWASGIMAALAAGSGFLFSRRLARRLQRAKSICQDIIGGDLSQRLIVSQSNDELDALAVTVNGVLARLDEQTQMLRVTLDSVAHDLRGPLYRMRSRLDDLLRTTELPIGVREGMEASVRDVDGVHRTLATLLQIARTEASVALENSELVDISRVAQDLVELYEPAALERGLTLRGSCTARAHVRGNRQLLAQAMANLIENAIKYVPRGGHIEVRSEHVEASARLLVLDNGPGIADGDRARALQPFVRLHAGSQDMGSGLGLNLVGAIVRLHKGQVRLEDNAPGLRVVIELPSTGAA